MQTLTTARLRLRPPSASDAPFIAELMNSDGYMSYIGDRQVRSASDAEAYLRSAAIYRVEEGLGFNIVETRSGATSVGICGLVQRDAYDAPDVGYALLDRCAGQGFASEATSVVLDHGFAELGFGRILGITTPSNGASRRVLEKCGMALERVADDVCVYAIDRAAWTRRAGEKERRILKIRS